MNFRDHSARLSERQPLRFSVWPKKREQHMISSCTRGTVLTLNTRPRTHSPIVCISMEVKAVQYSVKFSSAVRTHSLIVCISMEVKAVQYSVKFSSAVLCLWWSRSMAPVHCFLIIISNGSKSTTCYYYYACYLYRWVHMNK